MKSQQKFYFAYLLRQRSRPTSLRIGKLRGVTSQEFKGKIYKKLIFKFLCLYKKSTRGPMVHLTTYRQKRNRPQYKCRQEFFKKNLKSYFCSLTGKYIDIRQLTTSRSARKARRESEVLLPPTLAVAVGGRQRYSNLDWKVAG